MAVGSSSTAAREESAIRYGIVYLGLLALTLTTFLLSRMNFGIWSTVIALLIAVTKASLVVLFFMQLWQHRGSYRLVLATALVWLLLLMFFVVADVHTRFALSNPSNNPMAELPLRARNGTSTEPTRAGPIQHQTEP